MAELRVKSTGTLKLFESDNTSSVTIASPASLGADRTVTLPDGDVTLVSGTMLTSGGKIGQVVDSGTTPNSVTISNASFTQLTDGGTALVASITPAATSSSVLMQVVIQARCLNNRGYGVSLRRGGVEFYASATAYDIYNNADNADDVDRSVWMALDTGISTTSATEYSVYVKTLSGNAVTFQYGNDPSKIILMEILA